MLWIYLTGLDRHMKDIVHLSYRSYQRRQYRCCGDLRYKITRLGGGEGRGRGRRTCFKIESLSKWSVQFLQSSTLSSHNLTVSFIGYFSLSLSLFQSPPPLLHLLHHRRPEWSINHSKTNDDYEMMHWNRAAAIIQWNIQEGNISKSKPALGWFHAIWSKLPRQFDWFRREESLEPSITSQIETNS